MTLNRLLFLLGQTEVGKAIFEAMQLAVLPKRYGSSPHSYNAWINVFGGYESIKPKIKTKGYLIIKFDDEYLNGYAFIDSFGKTDLITDSAVSDSEAVYSKSEVERWALLENCRRLFIGHLEIQQVLESPPVFLEASGSNMISVLNRVLANKTAKEEITDWLQIFIPELQKVEVEASKISRNAELAVYEKNIVEPLPANLISDGTKNILSLLTAVYQSDEPQFLCIEEPENGLHPYVIKELVNFFRQQCQEKGHYIWLNTHSQTLVNQLDAKEIIVVNKKDGITYIKQFRDKNFHGLAMDEAWLSNAMGGGVPW